MSRISFITFCILSCKIHIRDKEVPLSSTSRPVSMTTVGSFRWGSEAGTAVGEAWGQEPDEEDGIEDEDTFMARQVQIFEADEAECHEIQFLGLISCFHDLILSY